jgi:hypothetical protein
VEVLAATTSQLGFPSTGCATLTPAGAAPQALCSQPPCKVPRQICSQELELQQGLPGVGTGREPAARETPEQPCDCEWSV